jgi:hypothetical protein
MKVIMYPAMCLTLSSTAALSDPFVDPSIYFSNVTITTATRPGLSENDACCHPTNAV